VKVAAFSLGRRRSLAAWFALAALLAGCAAGPRYQTVKRYVPPQGPAAQACLGECSAAMARCKQDCEIRYQSCARSVLPEAQARYSEQLHQYGAALDQYRWELERYRLDWMLGWGDPYWDAWGWRSPAFPPPLPPPAPSLDQEIARLTRERCDQDCGCQSRYDTCFVACGGEIRHETQCVAHCPGPTP
jgi:hypothetical protein